MIPIAKTYVPKPARKSYALTSATYGECNIPDGERASYRVTSELTVKGNDGVSFPVEAFPIHATSEDDLMYKAIYNLIIVVASLVSQQDGGTWEDHVERLKAKYLSHVTPESMKSFLNVWSSTQPGGLARESS